MPAELLPTPFLFRFAFRSPYVPDLPRERGALLELPPEGVLPAVSTLDEKTPGKSAGTELRTGWNEHGLGFALTVRGRTKPLQGVVTNPTWADGLQLWIDTRDTHSVHRATRFCHHFCLLATGGGRDGKQPAAVQLPIPRAKEDAPQTNSADVRLHVQVRRDGYDLQAWIPATALNGFDPEASSRLGWYYRVRDADLGDRFLTVSPEFPFATDPSVWSTLELVKSN